MKTIMGRFRGDLPVRTYDFATPIVWAVEDLPRRNAGWVLGKQMLRSGTSIGANISEADEALSEAEFIHRCSIGRKEASETRYWLRLCRDCGLLTHDKTDDLIEEAEEFGRILATIIRKSQDWLNQPPSVPP